MIWATCTHCGKRSYMTKHTARQARKLTSGHGLNVYRCDSGYWHVGHLPESVRRGRVTRREIYGGNERETA